MGTLFVKPMTHEQLKALSFEELMCLIQPLWNTYNMGHGSSKMSQVEIENLTKALEEYKDRGGDIAYFTAGAGAPNNCVVC